MSGEVVSRPVAAPARLADVEAAAAEVLPADVRDFVAGGSGDELTLRANRTAWDSWFVVPRVLRDVSSCATGTTLLGAPAAMPVAVAPIAYHRLVHPEGELASARAARAVGIPFSVATLSSVAVEEVVATGASTWFQLYWLRDRAASFELLDRAQDVGCRAVVLTADVPWMGRRPRDTRNGFTLPDHVTAANFAPAFSRSARSPGPGSAVADHTSLTFDPSLRWADLERVRARIGVPLVLKGVLSPRDAVRAVDCGVDGIVVSNHGGRQLDGAVATADALAPVCDAVAGRCEVLVDSGIRSGTDVLRALALGASGVLIGRPVLWALATGGEAGVERALRLLGAELRDSLGLAGCADLAQARRLTVSRRQDPPNS
jgi:4-hydroxymandelate oxidase